MDICPLQVYKKKTEVAKREYLKALAAYRANQLSQVTVCCLIVTAIANSDESFAVHSTFLFKCLF